MVDFFVRLVPDYTEEENYCFRMFFKECKAVLYYNNILSNNIAYYLLFTFFYKLTYRRIQYVSKSKKYT